MSPKTEMCRPITVQGGWKTSRSTFFAYRDDIPEEEQGSLFSKGHIIILCLLGALWLALILLAADWSMEAKWSVIRGAAFMLPVLELSRILWAVRIRRFTWGEFLPLHICGIMSVIMPIMAVTGSEFLQQYAFAVGLIPALIALITPDVAQYPVLSFQFLQSMLVHGTICFIPLFLVFAAGLVPDISQLPSIIGMVALLAAAMVPVNLLTRGNYFFLCKAPPGTPIELFYKWVGWPWYIVPTFLLGCVLWALAYLPFIVLHGL